MKTRKLSRGDILISLLIAAIASLASQGFWLMCERFPERPGQIIIDDRPLILLFNWYTSSKVLLYVFTFIYTFGVALIARKICGVPKTPLELHGGKNAGEQPSAP